MSATAKQFYFVEPGAIDLSPSSQAGLLLRVTTLSDLDPGAEETLVRIKALAVNSLDGIVRAGDFPIAKEPPLILGEEAAGIVERNGPGFKAGERVIWKELRVEGTTITPNLITIQLAPTTREAACPLCQ